MKRMLAIAIISFFAVNAANLQAQRGGGGARGGGGGGAARAGGAARGGGGAPARSAAGAVSAPGRVNAGAVVAGVQHPGISGGRGPVVRPPSTFTGRRSQNIGFNRRPFVGSVGFPAYGFGYPGYPGYPYYDPFSYAPQVYPTYAEQGYQDPAYSGPVYNGPVQLPGFESNQVNELTNAVEQLTQEVEQLRQAQGLSPETRNIGPIAPQPAAAPAPHNVIPTTLVFRDGRRMEAQGYAVIGQSLWVLTEQTSSRIPLSDLNLEATQRINAEHGVRFLLPNAN